MACVRVSTTVDERLLAEARRTRSGLRDSALMDEALAALVARNRLAEIDAAYAAYDEHPLDADDEWGDLASFRAAAVASTGLPAPGEVWWCELPEVGRRPVVVLSRDAAIPRLSRTLIGPCTTTIRGIPSEVLLEPGEDPIPRTSVVNLDSVESVPLATLVERLGRLSAARTQQVCKALKIAFACEG
jgi:mRNA interferase MazF